jgi:hypothetical protein
LKLSVYIANMAVMAREAWTDERLDDLNGRVSDGFREQAEETRALRAEVHALRSEMRGEVGALRSEMRGEIRALRIEMQGEIQTLRIEMQGEIQALRAEMNARFEAVDAKFDALNARFDAMQRLMISALLLIVLGFIVDKVV